ncbi:MAG TPA: DHHA1 domain-containing protein, partial [Verrucomicrobiae bacterium]|nr:DHHA1 domain-containing protein [Verrucomicrobiae bacterium]
AIRPFPDLIVHRGTILEGTLQVGDAADLKVGEAERAATARNHTATHLLQSALRQVLGEHVKQSGSLVTPERLRFDFTHFAPLSEQELTAVEDAVNETVMGNAEVQTREMEMEEAVKGGATALFGEKYGERVRVVRVGEVSTELCGGTHVGAAGEIGLFKIVSEAGIAAGVRRIEALTGAGALALVRELESEQKAIASLLKAEGGGNVDRIARLLAKQKELQRQVDTLQDRLNSAKAADLTGSAREVRGVKVLAVKAEVGDVKGLRDFADTLRDRLGSGIVVLGADIAGKANLLVSVSRDLSASFHAGNIIRALAPVVGGSGGGKAEMAQAGGSLPAMLDQALEQAYAVVEGL